MPSSPEQVKAAQSQVVELMKQRQYDRAIGVLMTLDHPKKTQWIAQVESKKQEWEFQQALTVAPAPPAPLAASDNVTRAVPVGKKKPGCVRRVINIISTILLAMVCLTAWAMSRTPSASSPSASSSQPKPFNQSQYTDILANNVSVFFSSATLDKVGVVQDASGHVTALFTFLSGASDLTGMVDEWIDVFRSVSSTARSHGLKIDTVSLVMGNALGTAVATIDARMLDIRAYEDGKLTRADFISRMDIVKF